MKRLRSVQRFASKRQEVATAQGSALSYLGGRPEDWLSWQLAGLVLEAFFSYPQQPLGQALAFTLLYGHCLEITNSK